MKRRDDNELASIREQLLKDGDAPDLNAVDVIDLIDEVGERRRADFDNELLISSLQSERDNAVQALAEHTAKNKAAIDWRARAEEAEAQRNATAKECNELLAQAAASANELVQQRDSAGQTLVECLNEKANFADHFRKFLGI